MNLNTVVVDVHWSPNTRKCVCDLVVQNYINLKKRKLDRQLAEIISSCKIPTISEYNLLSINYMGRVYKAQKEVYNKLPAMPCPADMLDAMAEYERRATEVRHAELAVTAYIGRMLSISQTSADVLAITPEMFKETMKTVFDQIKSTLGDSQYDLNDEVMTLSEEKVSNFIENNKSHLAKIKEFHLNEILLQECV